MQFKFLLWMSTPKGRNELDPKQKIIVEIETDSFILIIRQRLLTLSLFI